ncbi:MAG: hypothetical protein WBQ61_13465 [Candidatus Acidiferrum sp.]
MSTFALLPCDGCGQLVDSAHISRRLERLAWATRFRPIHIQALLLGGIAPKFDSHFLYTPNALFEGEAGMVLNAVQLPTTRQSPEGIQTEFQKLGLMFTHVLECPLADDVSESDARSLIEKQLPAVMARIRRSLKPKRVLLLSPQLQPYAGKFREVDLGCPVFPFASGVFLSSSAPTESDFRAFRSALAISNAHAV